MPLGVACVALNAFVPVVFYPFSKTIFLALDLILLHPDRWEPPASEVGPRALPTDGSPATSPTPNPRPDGTASS